MHPLRRFIAAGLMMPVTLGLGIGVRQPGAVPDPWPYPQKLAMVQRDVLYGVDGRLDHMALDPGTNVLYVAAFRNNSLEALHVPDSTTRQSIPDLPEPAGVLFIPQPARVVVACDGSVRVFKTESDGKLAPERTVDFDGRPDALRYDARAKRVYVGHGEMLGWFDLETGEKGADVKLPGAPEAFVLEQDGARVFINVPSKRCVAVVDRATATVKAEWPVASSDAALSFSEANYPMALDESKGRLFVATRAPARLFVIDTASGTRVAEIADICKDADDCWYDPVTRRVFVTGGGGPGGVSVIQQNSADDYKLEFGITTASGARTSLFVPAQRKLYVAAPRLGDDQAYVFVYMVGPR